MNPIREGNEALYLIDGPATYVSMCSAIQTATEAGHFIYLLGWWLDDNFPLIPYNPLNAASGAKSTLRALFSSASDRSVQVRAMLWDNLLTVNSAEVGRINKLARGAAILDNRTLRQGAHHQKVLLVYGTQGLIAFCGGLDISRDRVQKVTFHDGSPMHDVHCQIRGPAAHDLLRIFIERWEDHPDHAKLDKEKGALLGKQTSRPSSVGKHSVQIGRTYGNGSRHKGIGRGATMGEGYAFAPQGEQSAWQIIRQAIRDARRFIYIEDQYLVSLDISRELASALRTIEHLTILITDDSILFLPQKEFRRRQFLEPLYAAGDRVRVFIRKSPGAPHTYIHSKVIIVDDRIALIGSANVNRRGITHDSEVVARITDESGEFAHKLRVALWEEHLNASPDALQDGIASAKYWLEPPAGAQILPYREFTGSSGRETPGSVASIVAQKNWDTIYDPDGS